MKRSLTIILIGLAVLLVAGLTIAKDNEGPVTGTWTCQAHGAPQGDTPFTLSLQQTGEKVDGSVSSPMGGTDISSGTFKGDTLEIHIDTDNADYVLVAKLDKDSLSGTWSNGGNDKGTWEGKKQGPASK
jgi:hypothetical protein